MSRCRKFLSLSLLVVIAASCGKCGKPAGGTVESVERVLPRGAVGVVVVPRLASLGKKLGILENLKVTGFVAQLQGFADGKGFVDALVGQLGVDLRSEQALEAAGLDGKRAAAVAGLVTGHAYLVLPVKDAAQFHRTVEALAAKRLGASVVGTEGEVKAFRAREGAPPKLGYVLAHGFALMSDTAGLASLAGFASMTHSDSLSADPEYGTAFRKLPQDSDVLVYLPPGTVLLAQAPLLGASAAMTLGPSGLSTEVRATWKGQLGQLAAFEHKTGKSLLGYLPADAFGVARYTGAPEALAPWVEQVMGSPIGRALTAGGIDVKKQVLDALEPGMVASLSLSERPPMDRGVPTLDIRQTNPFAYAHLSGVVATKAQTPVMPVLAQVATVAPQFGADMQVKERADGQQAVLTTWAQGEGVHFAPKGELVFFASPVHRLDALVKSDGKGPMASAMEGLGDDALTMSIDLSKLAASVRALPESAWGIGGFAIKATTVRWLEATDDLKRITVALEAEGQELHARMKLDLSPTTRAP